MVATKQHDSDSWDKINIIPDELLTPPGQYYWAGTALQCQSSRVHH